MTRIIIIDIISIIIIIITIITIIAIIIMIFITFYRVGLTILGKIIICSCYWHLP